MATAVVERKTQGSVGPTSIGLFARGGKLNADVQVNTPIFLLAIFQRHGESQGLLSLAKRQHVQRLVQHRGLRGLVHRAELGRLLLQNITYSPYVGVQAFDELLA